MSTKQHWEKVYSTKPATGVSWYAPHLARSIELIERAAPDHHARIIDVGGGASTVADRLPDGDGEARDRGARPLNRPPPAACRARARSTATSAPATMARAGSGLAVRPREGPRKDQEGGRDGRSDLRF